MKKLITALLFAAAFTANAQTGAYDEQARAYVRQYKAWAIEEQQRTGVPAAITLAQGIHETQAGTSELATEANNHFGIKCKKSWTGETYAHTDDAPNECFRKYAKAYDSYKDHSDYLRQTPRYIHCFEQDITDYAAWARELKAAGYATNPKYAAKLVRIVEDFHLQDYTYEAMKAPQPQGEGLGRVTETAPVKTITYERPREVVEDRNIPASREIIPEEATNTAAVPVENTDPAREEYTEPVPVYGQLTMRNNLKGFYAHKGDVLLEPAIKYNMRYAKILELNDLPDAPLEADMFVYTEKKRGLGLRRQHTVKNGETMLQIAQSEGIQLRQLRTLNGMADGEEPSAEAVLHLQTVANNKPALRIGRETAAVNTYRQPAIQGREPEMIATGHPAVAVEEGMEEAVPEKVEAPKTVAKAPAPVVPQKTEQIPSEEMAMPVSKPVVTPRPQSEPRRTPPPPAPPKQKTYTIADEMAVGEEAPKYSPRYQTQNAEPVKSPTAETQSASEPVKEEPQDDFSRLKARLDKAVYAPSKTTNPSPSKPAEVVRTAEKTLPPAAPVTAANDGSPAYHYVKTGETAFGIAKQNNISMKQLMEWNNLNFEAIKVGQKLRVK